MSHWLTVLQQHCQATSQTKVAAKIGYSPAAVNQVLKDKYKGDLKAVESAVKGAFMGNTVTCPVLGDIGSNKCQSHQRRKFANTNPQRVALYRACRAGCPHSSIEPTEIDDV